MVINGIKIKVLYKKIDFNYVELLHSSCGGFCRFRYLKPSEHCIVKVSSTRLEQIEADKTYILQDAFKRYIKVIYRNGSLFTQILNGSKSNFFNITKKDALTLLSKFTLSDKKFVSYGIGWNIA